MAIVARNQDNHVDNIAFLMDKFGKRDDFTRGDFKACARLASMKRGITEAILSQVRDVVSHWRVYADKASVPLRMREQIQHALRLADF
jgi:serine/threonine-protein kinase HipA